MEGKILALATLPFIATACGQARLSLPIIHADGSLTRSLDPNSSKAEDPVAQKPFRPEMFQRNGEIRSTTNCYSFILLRPRDQRASAVQARLQKADRMAAAFDPHLLTVDIVGDHANILSLQFPVVWPSQQSYADRISTVLEDYFSSLEIEDYMCEAGFAEVRLAARGLNDRRRHPIWTLEVTVEGLVLLDPDSDSAARTHPHSFHSYE